MNFEVRPLRDILAERVEFESDIDEAVLGVQEWLRQDGILAIMYEGMIETGTRMLDGARLALIRQAVRK